MKKCRKCGKVKDYKFFEKSKTCKDGHRGTCRDCRRESRKIHETVCGFCGRVFKAAKADSEYCSRECSGASRRERVEAQCSFCGKAKEVVPSLIDRNEQHYCDQSCRTEHLKVLMTKENNPNYERTPYECDGCSKGIMVIPSRVESQKYIFCTNECYKQNIGSFFSGEDSSNWNHDLTTEERNDLRRYPEYYNWRSSVYSRDKYTCQACGDDKGGNLVAHHIYNYSEYEELRTVISNGVTLCTNCHIEFHKKYGYRNNNEQQLHDFLT